MQYALQLKHWASWGRALHGVEWAVPYLLCGAATAAVMTWGVRHCGDQALSTRQALLVTFGWPIFWLLLLDELRRILRDLCRGSIDEGEPVYSREPAAPRLWIRRRRLE